MREWNNTSKSETPRLIYRNKIESCDHTRQKIVDRKEFFTAPVALKSCLDRRRNSMTSAGQGFVKKLLFPSFADAGANDAFRGGDSNAGSEAPTEIIDNRSSQHGSEGKMSGSTTESTISTEFEHAVHPPKHRPFFPSTDPVPRPQLTARSISMIADVGSFHSSSLPLKQLRDSTELDSSCLTVTSSLIGQYLVGSDTTDNTPEKGNTNNQSEQGDEGNADESMSDVNSTASEMGTVIGVSSSRLADVNAMALMTPAQEDFDYDDDDNFDYSLPNREEVDGAGLALPTLDEKENKKSTEENNSASAIVSAAFRRLGKRMPGTVSAPSTPKATSKVEDYLKYANYQKFTAPASVSLRSPGSSAHLVFYKKEGIRPALSPRFSKSSPPATSGSLENQPALLRHANSLASPLRFARGCLSFDNTVDDLSHQPSVNHHGLGDIPESSPSRQNYAILQSKSWDPSSSSTPKAGPASAFRIQELQRAFDFRLTSGSNVHHMTDHSPATMNTQDAFVLQAPHKIEIEREDALDILACLVERSVAFDNENNGQKKLYLCEINEAGSKDDEQIQLDDDKVSTYVESGAGRVYREKGEDEITSPPKNRRKRLDLADQSNTEAVTNELVTALCELREISSEHQTGFFSHAARMKAVDELLQSHTYAVEMKRAAKSASVWLRSIGRTDMTGYGSDYANLNKRRISEAASVGTAKDGSPTSLIQSAGEEEVDNSLFVDKMDILAWKAMIHSAEQRANDKEECASRLNEELSLCRAEIGRLKNASRSEMIFTSPNRSILDYDDEESASSEAVSKADAHVNTFDGLPHTLSDIPVHDTSFDPSFISTNKQDHRNLNVLAEAMKESILLKASLFRANEVIRKLHSQLASGDSSDLPIVSIEDSDLIQEMEEYKEALRKAQQLENRLANHASLSSEEHNVSVRSDERMVNVKMLDAENFSTDWEELSPGLPPPPDHDLRSPIVAALLQQWTSDPAKHDSLISWMERSMREIDPEMIPPLTLSSLDYQSRDGFAMHVLPILLKRSDIHLDVKTRLHRRTTYDMAVTVTRATSLAIRAHHDETPIQHHSTTSHMMTCKATTIGGSLLDESMATEIGGTRGRVLNYLRTGSFAQASDIGNGSVSHSTVTTHITNASKLKSRLPPPSLSTSQPSQTRDSLQYFPGGDSLCDEASVGSSMTGTSSQKNGHQSGLINAFGNTFGGFLSRRHKTPSHHSLSSEDSPPTEPALLRQFPYGSTHQEGSDEQPYHRVVSAPPGRIGVTFVQYRGHAMVSDVAPESPLSGWVFPGDILIAIDEVPVSGMRVRDIVKLLTARKERQRALRVISSHAMNEFTLNQSALSDVVQN